MIICTFPELLPEARLFWVIKLKHSVPLEFKIVYHFPSGTINSIFFFNFLKDESYWGLLSVFTLQCFKNLRGILILALTREVGELSPSQAEWGLERAVTVLPRKVLPCSVPLNKPLPEDLGDNASGLTWAHPGLWLIWKSNPNNRIFYLAAHTFG